MFQQEGRGSMNTRVCAVSFQHAETLQATVNQKPKKGNTFRRCRVRQHTLRPKTAVNAIKKSDRLIKQKFQMCFLTILLLLTILSSNRQLSSLGNTLSGS